METTNVEVVSPIETALAQNNITAQVIERLKTDYLGLKINGLEDKAGFKKVEDARKECKALRNLAANICKKGREDAIKIQKDWIAKEKEVVSDISQVEDYLEGQSNEIKELEKQILFEAAQKAKLPARIEKLASIDISVEDAELLKMSDEQFNTVFNQFYEQKLAEKAEALKQEQQRIAAEAAEKERLRQIEVEKENQRLKAEQAKKDAEIEAERAEVRKREAAQEELRRIEQEKSDKLLEQQRKEADKKLKAEREAREKIEAELKAKQDAEAKIKADHEAAEKLRIAAEKKAAKAPDKEKLTKWVADMQIGLTPNLGGEAHKLACDIHVKLEGFKKWANEQIEKL